MRDLEHGRVARPPRETVRLLATALGLPEDDREELLRLAGHALPPARPRPRPVDAQVPTAATATAPERGDDPHPAKRNSLLDRLRAGIPALLIPAGVGVRAPPRRVRPLTTHPPGYRRLTRPSCRLAAHRRPRIAVRASPSGARAHGRTGARAHGPPRQPRAVGMHHPRRPASGLRARWKS
ncbi:hypothetical protein ACIHEJ_37610 [Streptomyces sp. NPDC052301]|uniref:hypothetical protein n=1 Tax=Streptomyces sp. NPDC052301 TaxID=3365687 RepID=UPI0037D00AA8